MDLPRVLLCACWGRLLSMLREALTRNNYLSALGRTKGLMVAVNLVANTDLRTSTSSDSSSSRSRIASSFGLAWQ